MMVGVDQADEQRPPIVGQCYIARQQAAAFQIMGREAAPAPVVLEFIKGVFDLIT
jgi:hypothetical protein